MSGRGGDEGVGLMGTVAVFVAPIFFGMRQGKFWRPNLMSFG
jgi:hypothetical protein